MIVASPRPVAAVSELAPVLRLRAEEIQHHLQMAQQTRMAIPISESDSNDSFSSLRPEERQNGDCSSSQSPLMSGDNLGETPPPKSRYTRYSTCSFTSPVPTTSHAFHPSTSSTSSSSTARPSFDTSTTPSDHGVAQQREEVTKPQQMPQEGNGVVHVRNSSGSELGSAPPYDSFFADTNLTAFPEEALTAVSLARENLTDLERASFADLDDLDRSDNRADPDSIVQRRLTRNALLLRQSALTFASSSSVYSDAAASQVPRNTLYPTSDFDPARVSVQTYGSSVLTYGSRASQLLDGEGIDSGSGSGDGGSGSRPVAPLPWLPRPSALDRIQHCGTHAVGGREGSESEGSISAMGRRPLPPLPTPTSASSTSLSSTCIITRDRSVSLPSRTNSSCSNYSVSSAGSSVVGRRPRPLPRTPTSVITIGLPNILEGEASESIPPSSGPVRSNSMFLSPASAAAPLDFKKRRGANYRYSTLGYGHGHLARAGVRGLFQHEEGSDISENSSQKQFQTYGRATSRASTRSARSTYLVPDVDELVRILDSMDDGSGSGSSSESALTTPRTGPWERTFEGKSRDDEEEIEIGSVLASSRSVVNVPFGEKRGGAAALEDLGVTKSIGLPTPAPTPRSSPHRQAENLPEGSKPATKRATLPQSQEPRETLPKTTEDAHSPAPSSATDALSLTNFPMPPIVPLYIPAPGAVNAGEMPIPSAQDGILPSPSLVDIGKSPAERATLPGLNKNDNLHTSQKHTSAAAAIVDLKSRISDLPVAKIPGSKGISKKFPSGVPMLNYPIPPRRRAKSTLNAKNAHLPSIDVQAANVLAPPSLFTIGKTAGSSSAPANNQFFDLDKPTIIYEVPAPVAPLRIRKTSTQTQSSDRLDAPRFRIPSASNAPQSANAVQTSFDPATQLSSFVRAQRATSLCVSPGASTASVTPLRFKSSKRPTRARSSTVDAACLVSKQGRREKPVVVPAPASGRKPSGTDISEESESDRLATPTQLNASLPSVVEHATQEDRNHSQGISAISDNLKFTSVQHSDGTHVSLDPAFADVIKSIAGASEEEHMGSLLTIASSINTEHHVSGYNAAFFLPVVDESRTRDDDGYVDVDEDGNETDPGRKETVRRSMASSISASEKRKSRARSASSVKKRQSTRSAAAAVRAAIRALPDPNTFPIPDSGGSIATNSSTGAAGADFSDFCMRPSPLPKLKVVTKFKGGVVLLPASQAPSSATSTKSTMSTFSGHSRNASAVSLNAKRSSATVAIRRMNRLTLTDPRSPMGEAVVGTAQLIARVRQKRASLALRNRAPGAGSSQNGQSMINVARGGHERTSSGSSGRRLRSKLKMSGGGFFGGTSMRAFSNLGRDAAADTGVDTGPTTDSGTVLRNGPRARRPTIHRPCLVRTSAVLPKSGQVDLCA